MYFCLCRSDDSTDLKLRKLLFWLFVLTTSAAYVSVGAMVVKLPCRGELLVGFCALSKIILVTVGAFLLAIYFLITLVSFRCKSTPARTAAPSQGAAALTLISLGYLALPIVFLFGILRLDPALQPFAIPALR